MTFFPPIGYERGRGKLLSWFRKNVISFRKLPNYGVIVVGNTRKRVKFSSYIIWYEIVFMWRDAVGFSRRSHFGYYGNCRRSCIRVQWDLLVSRLDLLISRKLWSTGFSLQVKNQNIFKIKCKISKFKALEILHFIFKMFWRFLNLKLFLKMATPSELIRQFFKEYSSIKNKVFFLWINFLFQISMKTDWDMHTQFCLNLKDKEYRDYVSSDRTKVTL